MLIKQDKRCKYNYKSITRDTGYLFAVYHIRRHNKIYDGQPPNSTKTNVRRALNSLKQKGLIEKISNPSKYLNKWESARWDVTDKGLIEISEINQIFQKELKNLRRKYGTSSYQF